MNVKINIRRLRGPWVDGYALDFHTLGNTFLGHDSYGHPRFDTARSPVGDLLYRLKYRNDQTAIRELVEAVMMLWESWKPPIDAIIPVPPSNVNRKSQPVMVLATALADRLQVPVCTECLTKSKRTAQLKDVFEYF
jgi:predicted amidophosphoribosyltransferase